MESQTTNAMETTLTIEVNKFAKSVSELLASEQAIKGSIRQDPQYEGCKLYDFVCIKTGNVYTFFSSIDGRFFPTTSEARYAYQHEQVIEVEYEEPMKPITYKVYYFPQDADKRDLSLSSYAIETTVTTLKEKDRFYSGLNHESNLLITEI